MAGKYAIETVFKLIDKVARPLDKIGIKSKSISNAIKHDFDRATKRVDALGASLAGLGKGVVIGGVAAISAGIGIATKQFIDFDNAVIAASAKFKDVDVTSADYQKTLESIGRTARDVAAVTKFNAVDTAGALDKMAMSGLTSNQAMSLLMGTTNLATATGMDLTSAVDMATDALGTFGLMVSEDTPQANKILEGNLNRLSDVMAKTTNIFNTDLNAMFEAVKQGASTFTSTGQSLEDFSALLGVMANQGKKGGEAGTVLRNMMGLLAKPAKPAAEALEALGIKTQDASGNFLNIIDILEQFEKAFKGMGDATKQGYLKDIFGQQNINGITMMLAEGTAGIRTYSDQLKNAGGFAEKISKAMQNSIASKIDALGSALTELGFKFIETFRDKGVSVLEKLIAVVSNFDPAPLVAFAEQVVDSLWKLGAIIVKVINYLWNFRIPIIIIAGTIGIYKGALMAAALALKTFTVFQGIAKAATFTFTLITKGQTAALALLKSGTIASAMATKVFAAANAVSIGIQNAFTAVLKFQVAWLRFFKLDIIAAKIATLAHTAAVQVAVIAGKAFAATTQFISSMIKLLRLDILATRVSVIAHTIAINTAGAAQKVFAFITGGLSKMFQILKLDIIAVTIATKAQAFAAKAAAIAQGILNVVMSMNPIGLVILAIVALIGVIILLVKNWDRITTAIKNNSEKVMFFISLFLGPFGFVISMIKELISNWGQVTAAFQNGGILEAIKRIGGILLSGLLAPVQGLLEILALIPGVGIFAGKGADKIDELRNSLKRIDTATATVEVISKKENSFKIPAMESLMKGMSGNNNDFNMSNYEIPNIEVPSIDMQMPNVEIPKIDIPDLDAVNIHIPDTEIPDIKVFGQTPVDSAQSKLHGVYDINSAIPSLPVNTKITDTSTLDSDTTKKINAASLNQTMVNLLTGIERSVTGIAQRVQGITPAIPALPETPRLSETVTGSINTAVRNPVMPISTVTGTPSAATISMPEILMASGIDLSIGDIVRSIQIPINTKYIDGDTSKDIAPVTQAERMAYSLQERREIVAIEVSAAKGSEARIIHAPKDIDVQLIQSGGNG